MLMKTMLKILPKNEIVDECRDGSGLLMTRYYLTPKIFGCRLVIHQFHRSDNDRHYHDHPWNFISIVLKGKYYEHMPFFQFYNSIYVKPDKLCLDERFNDTVVLQERFSIIRRPKSWKHWVELPEHFADVHLSDMYGRVHIFEECWTLVFLYGRRRDWGFWTQQGWIKHDQYDCRGDYNAKNSHQKSNTSTD